MFYASLPEAADVRATDYFWETAKTRGLLAYWRESGRLPDLCGPDPSEYCPRIAGDRIATPNP